MHFVGPLVKWLIFLVPPPTSDLIQGRLAVTTSSAPAAHHHHHSLLLEPLVEHPAIAALALDRRPRRKLHPRHKKYFPENNELQNGSNTSTLFNRLGRMACELGVVPRKELFETYAAAVLIHHHFFTRHSGIHRIADMAAGHGLLSWFLLAIVQQHEHQQNDHELTEDAVQLNNMPTTALCVDKTMPGSATDIAHAMRRHFPDLAPLDESSSSSTSSSDGWTYVEADLAAVEAHPSTLMVSVHACGSLTDFLIEKAIAGQAPLAVVPCCHTIQPQKGYMPHPVFSRMTVDQVTALVEEQHTTHQTPMEHVLDEIRIQTLQNAGYHVEQVLLPSTFTKQNRLILATPPSSASEKSKKHHSKPVTEKRVDLPSAAFFERQAPTAPSSPDDTSFYGLRIPLADDPKSRAFCLEISGRAESAKRLRQAIPKYYAPRLDVSIWLSGGGREVLETSTSAEVLKEERELIQLRLQKLSLDCCKSYNKAQSESETDESNPMVTCSVKMRGPVAAQQSTGKLSQCYRVEYTATIDSNLPDESDKNYALQAVSKETARTVDDAFRKRIEDDTDLSIRGR